MIKMIMFDIKDSEKNFVNEFDTLDFDITFLKEDLNETTKLTVKEYDETSIISIFLTSKITKKVLDKFKNLRLIVARSTSYTHIDLEECRKRNIGVINAVNCGNISVSQYVFGVILALTRKMFLSANEFRKGINCYEKYQSREVKNFSIGVLGTGSIGQEVCTLANMFGMKVFANDIKINNEISDFVEYVSFTDLLRKSDIITLHIPYIKECKYMFSSKEFEIMKNGSYLINTSQGDFIDYAALYKALINKKINGVGLDVAWDIKKDIFEKSEDKVEYNELEKIIVFQKIMEMDNVILTPGIACNTEESLNKILKSNFNDIGNFFKGMKTNRVV